MQPEEELVHSLRETLEHATPNYRVSVAYSGAEALDILDAQPVDLLVTDLRMPGVDGLELVQAVHEIRPRMCMILITAFGSPEVEDQARGLGVIYLPKPFACGNSSPRSNISWARRKKPEGETYFWGES